MTWGVRGINKEAKHICYVGGLDSKNKPKNTLNESQAKALNIYDRPRNSKASRHFNCGTQSIFTKRVARRFYVPDLLGECFDIAEEKPIFNKTRTIEAAIKLKIMKNLLLLFTSKRAVVTLISFDLLGCVWCMSE